MLTLVSRVLSAVRRLLIAPLVEALYPVKWPGSVFSSVQSPKI